MHLYVLCSVTFIFSIHLSSAYHFYGGTLILQPPGSGRFQYTAIFRGYWRGTNCNQCSRCSSSVTTIYKWDTCFGFEHTFTPRIYYNGYEWGGSWTGAGTGYLSADIITTIRTDNGLYNNPPVTYTIPVLVMQQSCSYEIYLTVYDLDGDDLRCRFATGDECSSACGKLTGATIDANTCKLSYTPPSSLTGYLPVTVQVEDFYNSSSSTALSSIPLQFLVYAKDFGTACNTLPEIVTPIHNAVYDLAVSSQFDLNVTARSTSAMSQIEVNRPLEMTVSASTTWSAAGYSYISTIATWTPSLTDERAHVVCFMAIDSGQSASSKQTCVVLVVSSTDASAFSTTPSAGTTSTTAYQACSEGTYGSNCNQACGHCSNREPCDTTTGECTSCSPGFVGWECKQACEPGSFGNDCNSMCGKCYDNAPCDTVTGACDQCTAGFKGVTCSTACENGTYGSSCRLACGHCYGDQPCNKVDGTCGRCDVGYLGDLCETECISGTYGQDCSTSCGLCLKYETCNHVTGLCSKGCAAGRQGKTCKQACGNYTFGVNCRQRCNCIDGNSCDSINGECENGLCAKGFFGVDCQQINGGPNKSDGNNQGMIIGVVFGVACIIIVLVVAGVCFLKIRKRDVKSSEIVTKPTDEHQYEDLHLNQL